MSREQQLQPSNGRSGLLARLRNRWWEHRRSRRGRSEARAASRGSASPRWDAYDVYFMALGPRR